MSSERVDTLHSVGTPEGVTLELRVAGPVVRGLAWGVDALIKGAVYIGSATVLSVLGEAGAGLMLLIWFTVEWLYPVTFEVFRHGATPGKSTMGLVVIHEDGTAVGWQSSMLRNLLSFADFLPVFYGVGLTSMTLTRGFQRLGDLAAGTLVVYRTASQHERAPLKARAVPPPLPLTPDEQRSIIDFAERSPELSPARARELALLAKPLLESSAEPVKRLRGIAAWLLGER